MEIRPGIELANLSDVGCERSENEDYYAYAEPESEDEFEKRGRLAVVADGMGGYKGGQIASALAVDLVRQTYFSFPSDDPQQALLEGFRRAHEAIQEWVGNYPEFKGMGTTCTAAVLRGGELYYGHVGDSRLYLLRDSRILRLTQDHSFVNRLLERGLITREQAAVHPERNVLTAALGMNSPVPVDLPKTNIPLRPADILLLCTDGLHGLVNDDELLNVGSHYPPREACHTLVGMAKKRGGPDNITLQIIRIDRL
jgi:serine/threonine protein phosphatase PrpC